MPADLRTHAIVLRRTNFGESDRILNLLTPEGKVAVIARGVRKERSKLAGGIELFSVADVVVRYGRGAQSRGTALGSQSETRPPLGTLTSAKMLKFYNNILTDLATLELASHLLKKLDRAAEQTDNPAHFDLLSQSLAGLDRGDSPDLISAWFTFNLARASGEEINLLCDVAGQPLSSEAIYLWDPHESALRPDPAGNIRAPEIKLARFLLANPLRLAKNIENVAAILPPLLPIIKTFE